MKYEVGDWVRFQRSNMLHVGIIEYIREQKTRYPYEIEYVTSCGIISESEILEARRTALEKA